LVSKFHVALHAFHAALQILTFQNFYWSLMHPWVFHSTENTLTNCVPDYQSFLQFRYSPETKENYYLG
jgi:hypothetical protein